MCIRDSRTGIRQFGCFRNGYLAFENQTVPDGITLSSQSTGDGSNVLTALRTILLRDILSGKFEWSDKVHLPAQPAFTAADALGRLTDRIYKNAIQLSG